jgi:RNA polymerase sigma factor (TIGR02999 family)
MSPEDRGEVTVLLDKWRSGDAEAGEALVKTTYGELRRLARAQMRRERQGHTLQATALLHEACLRLLPKGPLSVEGHEAFFRLMAAEMRRRLVDHARRRLADKRGGGAILESLDTSSYAAAAVVDDSEAMLDRLDRALERLARLHPRTARVVELRYISGLTNEETATELDLSAGTVKREWAFAKAWLAAAIESDVPRPASETVD